MKAEATAEKRPAWYVDQHQSARTPRGAHEDQGRIQIFFVLLQEFPVVLLGYFSVVFIELSLMALSCGQYVLLPAARRSTKFDRG